MKLSIVIVNYNVAYFLEQCLHSVFASNVSFNYEVFVVDNNSIDGSNSMVRDKFPEVILIENKENLGFSKANNQALRLSKGEYVLLLNPDTLLESDTLSLVVDFMENHVDAGGLGVKMLDGKGNFLPESKRGLPTPKAAFFKIFGLSKIFPKSKLFSAYHLGNLDQDTINQIEVLSGAFMLMRRKALDKVGLLDEDFFMYGEDIDLSYRILQGGYKNYYFPKTRIIHYKGESTKKDSINYVFVFYKAMIIFAKKHYSTKNAQSFTILINMAIIFKAALSILGNFVKKLSLALVDFIIIYSGLWFFANYWGVHFAKQAESYPRLFLYIIIPLFIVIDLLSIYYNGGYEKPIKPFKILKGHLIGILMVFVIYALLPETYRFSRALILFGALYIPSVFLLWRFLANIMGAKELKFGNTVLKRILLVGNKVEVERVVKVLDKTKINIESHLMISPATELFDNIDDVVKINKINEVIFCAKDLSSAQIIELMTQLQQYAVDFKIAPPESMFIIGSNSINTAGDIYFQDINSISTAENRRYKRLFDVVFSFLLILFFPVMFFLFKKPFIYLKNLFMVFFNFKSLVGFDELSSEDVFRLPKIKKGILHPSHGVKLKNDSELNVKRLNMVYARDYKIATDLLILVRGFRALDRVS